MKRMLTIYFERVLPQYLAKDMCAFPYYLAMYYDWQCTFAYFTQDGSKLANTEFEQYCKLQYLGKTGDYDEQKRAAKAYLKQHALEYDVLCFFNYGGATYSLAQFAKKINPHIKVYSKLDMSEGGFSHFYDGTLLRSIKSSVEVWKSRAIDLFTVENSYFYSVLKNTLTFKNRIKWLPNGVSMLGINSDIIAGNNPKKDIIVSVGFLGTRQKNQQLLVRAMEKVDRDLFKNWKVFLIGSDSNHFTDYLQNECEKHPWLKEHVLILGLINDREKLYTIYSEAKIVCMTSRWESFGIVPIEGMFFGAYPVLTNYGTIIDDITDHQRYGKVVSSDDVDALVRALEQTVQMPDYKKQSKAIEDYARQKYGYKYLAGKLDGYLTKLLSK